MPDMEPNGLPEGRLPHISIDGRRSANPFRPPTGPREVQDLRKDYPGHAQRLEAELARSLDEAFAAMAAARMMPTAEAGAYLEFETLPKKPLPIEIERRSDGIRVANLRVTETGAQVGTIYVPASSSEALVSRVRAYGTPDIGNRSRPYRADFEVVETIRARGFLSLWTEVGELPEVGEHWWELWCFSDRVEAMPDVLQRLGVDKHPDRLTFPDVEILFVHATPEEMRRVAANSSGAIMEVRLAKDTPSVIFEDRDIRAQQPWLEDLVARLEPPPPNGLIVCVHDSGVARAHPLLSSHIAFADALDANWNTSDHVDGGHGTQMCGLALHGDLFGAVQDHRPLGTSHLVGSVKLLPPPGVPDAAPASYGLRTVSTVAIAEENGGDRVRAHCIALSTPLHDPTRPSSWSASVDRAASGADEQDDDEAAWQGPKRLFLIAAGNIPRSLSRDAAAGLHPIEDPAQSWNALTIGGYTARDRLQPPEDGAVPLARANERSPYSRVSAGMNTDSVPIKPDVVFEAGNLVVRGDECDHGHESVSLLTTGKRFQHGRPLTHFWATSAACGVAGHFAGMLAAATPDLWPETHRALIVHSADWTAPMQRRLRKSYPKARKIAAVREFGFGVPNIERALGSARNDVALVAQSAIQPFRWEPSAQSAVFNDIHYYDLPWPVGALLALENAEVRLKVTLSYFVEPNPGGRAATRDDTYRSFGLRFDLQRSTETRDQFRSRKNRLERGDDPAMPETDKRWLLGPKAIRAGSLHCDVWTGPAAELATRSMIAVHPVGGWWKRRRDRANDVARYALVISLDARGLEVDLHSAIAALLTSPVQVSVDA